jgi:hypothetical protein
VTLPGKTRAIGAAHPGAAPYVQLVREFFHLGNAREPAAFMAQVSKWASLEAYQGWLAAYRANDGSFLQHAVWGADRDLGGGQYLYGAMDDRYASNAARVFVPGGLDAAKHVKGKRTCVVGAWDGTECLLLRALGASSVDAVEEVPAFCEMARAQYQAWGVPGEIYTKSLYEIDVGASWQAYDLLYVPGVMYHLTDLTTALVILWSMLAPGGVLALESIADVSDGAHARYLGASAAGWNWWSPTPACFMAAMRDCGFADARTVEHAHGRGWWIGTRSDKLPALATGAAGFSRPDILRTIASKRTHA